MSSGKKILDGLTDALAFARGDETRGRVWRHIPERLTDEQVKQLGLALNDKFPGLHPGNARSYAKAVHAALVATDFRKGEP